MPQNDYEKFENEDLQFYLNLWMFSRHIKDATKFIKEKKVQSGLKATLTNLTTVGLKITGMILSAGGTEMLGAGTALAELGFGSGATIGALSADGIAVPLGANISDKVATSTVQYKGPESFSQVRNVQQKTSKVHQAKEVGKTLVKGALMVPQLKAAFEGLKQVASSRTEWQRHKLDVIRTMNKILSLTDELVIEWAQRGKIKVTWKGSVIPLRNKTVMSDQITRKYRDRATAFRRAGEAREVRKERSGKSPLLSSSQQSDD